MPLLEKYEFKKKLCWSKTERISTLYDNVKKSQRLKTENQNFLKFNNLNTRVPVETTNNTVNIKKF